MSAFIVSRNHIAALVEAMYRYDVALKPCLEPEQLGQLLWDENITSVQYRYHGDALVDLPGPLNENYCYMQHTATTTIRRFIAKPTNVFMIACCYIYQSCEHPAWENSQAFQIVNALCAGIIEKSGMSEKAFRVKAERESPVWDLG